MSGRGLQSPDLVSSQYCFVRPGLGTDADCGRCIPVIPRPFFSLTPQLQYQKCLSRCEVACHKAPLLCWDDELSYQRVTATYHWRRYALGVAIVFMSSCYGAYIFFVCLPVECIKHGQQSKHRTCTCSDCSDHTANIIKKG